MATWDGSCPEDPSTVVRTYSSQNTSGSAADSWPHFANDIACMNVPAENGHIRNGNRDPYQVYEQTGSTVTFYSSMQSNSRQKHPLPNASTYDGVQVPSNNSMQHSTSDVASSSRNDCNRLKWNNPAISNHVPATEDNSAHLFDMVENSNLHPLASEFVPTSIKPKKERFNRRNRYNNEDATGNNTTNLEYAGGQSFRPKSFPNKNAYSSENRYKNNYNYNNRSHFSAKRDTNYYKQRNPSQDVQTAQPGFGYKQDAHRTYNNARNFGKYQNGRYYNRRYRSNDSSFEEQNAFDAQRSAPKHKFADVPDNQDNISRSSTSSTIKETQENNSFSSAKHNEERTRQNDNSENAPSDVYNTQQNKPKRVTSGYANGSNYYKYSVDDAQTEFSPKHRTAAIPTRYAYRRNNDATAINQRETKVKNWRNRTETDETAQAQRKTPKKKHENGMFAHG